MTGKFGELLLILLIVFVLFGAGKLPRVMSDLGRGLRSFKKGLNNSEDVKHIPNNKHFKTKKKSSKAKKDS